MNTALCPHCVYHEYCYPTNFLCSYPIIYTKGKKKKKKEEEYTTCFGRFLIRDQVLSSEKYVGRNSSVSAQNESTHDYPS